MARSLINFANHFISGENYFDKSANLPNNVLRRRLNYHLCRFCEEEALLSKGGHNISNQPPRRAWLT